MIYLTGITAAIATANAAPPVVLDWVDTFTNDYPIGPLTYLPGFDVTLGTLFTTTAGGVCTGIRMRLGTASGTDPNYVQLILWAGPPAGFFAPLSSEIIPFNPAMYGQIVQTTGAFAPVALLPATQYIASVYINGSFGPYNYAPGVPVGYLPKSYAQYAVEVGSQSGAGVGITYPGGNDPNYANYIEPLIA